MKEELRILLDSKARLFQDQKNFSRVLSKRYPCLISENLKIFEDDLNAELEFLLSSSLVSKSGRIKIIAPQLSNAEIVVLTRNPGLKYPHQSYSAFKPSDISEIDEQGNLLGIKEYGDEKRGKVILSALKGMGQINQDKLENFYIFQKEFIVWEKDRKTFIPVHSYRVSNEEGGVKIGDHRIDFYDKGFQLYILKDKNEKGYGRWTEIKSSVLKLYKVENWNDSYNDDEMNEDNEELNPEAIGRSRRNKSLEIEDQKELISVLNDFESFDKVLLEFENDKVTLVSKGKDLLRRLQDYNKPFRILNKLIN